MARGGNILQDRVGNRYGAYTVVSFEGYREYASGKRRSLWKVRCDCGREKILTAKRLTEKEAGSCGCAQKIAVSKAVRTHGLSTTKLYKVWTSIKQRCLNSNDKHYPLYGGRGIGICDEWAESFEEFHKYVGDRPSDSHSIDRIDNNKGYEPGNIRWATQKEQTRNLRKNVKYSIDGAPEKYTAGQLSEMFGVCETTIIGRIKSGMSASQAVRTPKR